MKSTLYALAESWRNVSGGLHSQEELLEWIESRNRAVEVEIRKTTLEHCGDWHYDEAEGCIRNRGGSFFSITGLLAEREDGSAVAQPVILQREIGYLGILCREINGVLHFLMQAKIEPGNVNAVQISPTIQATKSNFTRKHGGAAPAFLEYFKNERRYEIVVDQIQSEQSSRFYKKRNRNLILRVEEDIPVPPTHRWMTLGQIKRLMREKNLVNMDTRTVLSCIPYSFLSPEESAELSFSDNALYRSVFGREPGNPLPNVYRYLNDWKMYAEPRRRLIPLDRLPGWRMRDGEFSCDTGYPFKVAFCDISIEGREVRRWAQPLFEANGIALFGLLCVEDSETLKFLVRAAPEAGCFDGIELGPTVHAEAGADKGADAVTEFFMKRLERREGVMFDQLLSEEGGRFYHEQNRNVLLRCRAEELPPLPEDCFLLSYRTLNSLIQVNNTLNIQLRNLLALLEA